MAISGYFLGCPIFAFRGWVGSLYTSSARGDALLEQYASVFNAVEGNGTFYGLPEPETVARWRALTPETFRFCFKLPRRITHELQLRGASRDVDEFLKRLEPLGARLGPFMIQLPAELGPAQLSALRAFLCTLPRTFRFGVELRHPAFFASDALAQEVATLLEEGGCERIVLDTRALRAGPQTHADVVAATHIKPDLPVPEHVGGALPIVRFISHPIAEVNEPWLELWMKHLAHWIGDSRTPYFFVHCPNNEHSPALARHAHALLGALTPVGDMPEWPGERSKRPATRQMSLFG